LRKLEVSAPIPDLLGATVGDFWSWAYSDMLSNVIRSVYAEFLVASALGFTHEPRMVRKNASACDCGVGGSLI